MDESRTVGSPTEGGAVRAMYRFNCTFFVFCFFGGVSGFTGLSHHYCVIVTCLVNGCVSLICRQTCRLS